MNKKLEMLHQTLYEAEVINQAAAVLMWDQVTNMPPEGIVARGEQLALLRRLASERMSDPQIGHLLDVLASYEDDLPYDHVHAATIRVARRNFDRESRLPKDFWGRVEQLSSRSIQEWFKARDNNDFESVRPNLEKMVELSREFGESFPGYEHIADPILSRHDYGMTAAKLRSLFSELRGGLQPLIDTITEQPIPDESFLHQFFPREDQISFIKEVISDFGFDFKRGRYDAAQPRMIRVAHNDVRILGILDENFLLPALFSTTHEAGHAFYELGINQEYEKTSLGRGTSDGMHEGQSLLWETKVAKSRPFWEHYYPKLQNKFPDQLGEISLEKFYKAINKVERTTRRLGADEITYNLHVMIRVELGQEMLDGSLEVKDLPQVWHDRYDEYIGVVSPDNSGGALQDIHWYAQPIGGCFQSYILGMINSSIMMEAATTAHPEIEEQMGRGEFDTLHSWLKENVYQHGSRYTASELVERVTGGPITAMPLIEYLQNKYEDIYSL